MRTVAQELGIVVTSQALTAVTAVTDIKNNCIPVTQLLSSIKEFCPGKNLIYAEVESLYPLCLSINFLFRNICRIIKYLFDTKQTMLFLTALLAVSTNSEGQFDMSVPFIVLHCAKSTSFHF